MEIKITTHDIKKAMNLWTLATATVDGKTYRIQMVRFDETSRYESGRDASASSTSRTPTTTQ